MNASGKKLSFKNTYLDVANFLKLDGESQIFLRSLIYAIVMVVLFIGSYVIQQRWVFSNKKSETKSFEVSK